MDSNVASSFQPSQAVNPGLPWGAVFGSTSQPSTPDQAASTTPGSPSCSCAPTLKSLHRPPGSSCQHQPSGTRTRKCAALHTPTNQTLESQPTPTLLTHPATTPVSTGHHHTAGVHCSHPCPPITPKHWRILGRAAETSSVSAEAHQGTWMRGDRPTHCGVTVRWDGHSTDPASGSTECQARCQRGNEPAHPGVAFRWNWRQFVVWLHSGEPNGPSTHTAFTASSTG